MDIFIARQPIFNTNREVIAYELLYRESSTNQFTGSVSSNVATSILLMNTYLNIGLQDLVGDKKAFVNFDAHLIMNDIPNLLNKESVVIELLEDIVPDDAFINKIKQLKADGYTIAIDDVIEGYPYKNLIQLSDIVKVEFMGASRESIRKLFHAWKPLGKKMLAEKVETEEEFLWAKNLGFDYFQGYFFEKPAMVSSKKLNDNATQYVRLMNAMNVPEPDYKALAKIIESDVALTYKTLKLVNAQTVNNHNISSITHALSYLGIKAIKRWLSLAMVQSMSDSRTSELFITSLVRSHLLEQIATHSNMKTHAQELTFIGIISILDVILEKPMTELMDALPLADEVKNTLLGQNTLYSSAYNLCLSYEKGDFVHINSLCSDLDYDLKLLPGHYLDAVRWADTTAKAI